ncbi:hypothetical protein ACFOGJ_12680 [Marinibaculum pumilum]|uniref:Uncharacterized protein n=1 Tax=Marinibaculum pumilum TaxID=1766165 RepID=A0ABV7L0J6_9PROT
MTTAPASSRVTPLLLRQRLTADGAALQAFRAWTGAASGTRLPSLQDLEPLLASGHNAQFGIADLMPALGQFRYRVLGAALAALAGADCAGRIAGGAEDPSPAGRLDRAAFLESAFGERIVFSRRKMLRGSDAGRIFDRLVLPLRGAGRGMAAVLFAHHDGSVPPHRLAGPGDAHDRPKGHDEAIEELERVALAWVDCAHEFHRSA